MLLYIISKILDLNDTQAGIIAVSFKYSDDKKLPLLDKQEVAQYFSHPNLLVFTDNTELTAHLKGINYEKTNLLMMSSGNFGGMNLNNMANFATGNKNVKYSFFNCSFF